MRRVSIILTALVVAVSPTTVVSLPVYISLSGTNVALTWPTNNATMVAEVTTNIFPPAAWKKIYNPIVVTNGFNSLALPLTNTQEFYRLVTVVDPRTMYHKLLMGYQGWFACAGDGSPSSRWIHWFRNSTPTANNVTFDMWPDTSELDADELFLTGMTNSDGSRAKLFSAYKQKTVLRHFKWMQDNELDGVFFQRFLTDISGSIASLRNQVAINVRTAAETYGRVFAIMYDISGYSTNTLVSRLASDWYYLVNTQNIINSPAYLHHNGKPVVAIWGFGFSGRPDTPQQAQAVIDYFKSTGCTVMGGLPTNWRTLYGDAQTDPAWSNVFRSFDIISPWTIGRYSDNSSADNYRVNYILPDLAAATNAGREYMPVIFPGFSWTNLNGGPFNEIPRNGGAFYWRQSYNAIRSGCTMIYGAMFDEVDEGTAMFKIAPTGAQLPAQGAFVPLNIDGINLPSDWYLRIANEAGKMLRGEIPLQSTIPITP